MNTLALQDASVGAIGGFFVALLVLFRLVGRSDSDYQRVSAIRRWRIIGLSTLLGAVLVWLYGLLREPTTAFDIAVGAVGGLFIALLILWRIGPSDEAYERVSPGRRWRVIIVSVVLGAILMGVYGYIR